VKSSDGDTVDTLIGTKGRIRCVALIDTPLASGDWEVVQVEDAGTWTPIIVGVTTVGTGTYTLQTGIFSRSGSAVVVSGYVGVSNHTGTGIMGLAALPFISKNSTNCYHFSSILDASTLTISANSVPILSLPPNSSRALFVNFVAGSALSAVSIDVSFSCYFSMSYQI
jgi:hypothetical protein